MIKKSWTFKMSTLTWDKPKQVLSKDQWKSISADGAPPGVFQPNMSREDMKKWKAKLVKGSDGDRVEIRKTAGQTQLLLMVYKHGDIRISANGKAFVKTQELVEAIAEAQAYLTT